MELLRALATFAEAPSPETSRLAALLELGEPPEPSEHNDLFLFQLYPYASVYLGEEGKLGGEARDRIAGFWRALGEEPPAEPDHLASLLGFYAGLVAAEKQATGARQQAADRRARSAFFWEHLMSWLPLYLAKLGRIAKGLYSNWRDLLVEALLEERRELGEPERLPIHLRHAPLLQSPDEIGGRDFLTGLLTPVRSGLILVRSDLVRAARETGLGTRIGERRYVLESFFAQDPDAILAWLRSEIGDWSSAWRKDGAAPALIAEFWAERAKRTEALLASALDEIRSGG